MFQKPPTLVKFPQIIIFCCVYNLVCEENQGAQPVCNEKHIVKHSKLNPETKKIIFKGETRNFEDLLLRPICFNSTAILGAYTTMYKFIYGELEDSEVELNCFKRIEVEA